MSGGCSASLMFIPRRAPKGGFPHSGIASWQFIGGGLEAGIIRVFIPKSAACPELDSGSESKMTERCLSRTHFGTLVSGSALITRAELKKVIKRG